MVSLFVFDFRSSYKPYNTPLVFLNTSLPVFQRSLLPPQQVRALGAGLSGFFLHIWVYSLGIIGKSRKSWLRETIEMTVEYVKAVAAHLRCHYKVLGTVGSSIRPRKWAQSS